MAKAFRALACALLAGCLAFGAAPCAPAWQAQAAPATKAQLVRNLNASSNSTAVKSFSTSYKVGKGKAGKRLIRYVKKLRKRYKLNFVVLDVKTGQGISCSPKRKMYSASTLKGPYVAAVNKYKPGKVDSSARRLMKEAIVWSDNEAYYALRRRYGSGVMKKLARYTGVSKAYDHRKRYTWLSTRDLAKLWVGVYWYFFKHPDKNAKRCRSLYTHGYNSFIYQAHKGKTRVYAKPGWYPGGGKDVQNDAGIVMAKVKGGNYPYVLAVTSSACERYGALRKLVKLVDAAHAEMVRSGVPR